MKTHFLKTEMVYWDAVERGEKTFELRLNDRFFQRGDRVILARWSQELRSHVDRFGAAVEGLGAAVLEFTIGSVLQGDQYGLMARWCIFSLLPLQPVEEERSAADGRPESCSQALADVADERARQMFVENFLPERDDAMWTRGQLAGAAACYALEDLDIAVSDVDELRKVALRRLWPWAQRWWKPQDPRRNLVRAAALLIAEIERRDRAVRSASNG